MGQPHEYAQPVSIGPYEHMHLLAHVGFYDTYGYYVRGFYRLLRHHMRHGLANDGFESGEDSKSKGLTHA